MEACPVVVCHPSGGGAGQAFFACASKCLAYRDRTGHYGGVGHPFVMRVELDTAALVWSMLFGLIGLGFFMYGKNESAPVPMFCGLLLMVYPYFVSDVLVIIAVGLVLMVIPFVVRI